jgi:hypothetical protein
VQTPLWTYSEETPAALDAPQFVLPPLIEFEPRTDDEIANGLRNQELASACKGTDARPDVNGEPAHVAADPVR